MICKPEKRFAPFFGLIFYVNMVMNLWVKHIKKKRREPILT